MKYARLVAVAFCMAVWSAGGARAASTNDPLSKRQWALTRIQAERAWNKSRGAEVMVAIIDSGVSFTHVELSAQSAGSWDCRGVRGEEPCREAPRDGDEAGHGTRVAGIVAGATGNRTGIASVAPDARIMSVRVLGPDGTGTVSDVTRALRWAVEKGARVINVSLAEFFPAREFERAVDDAWESGSIIVASAGNDESFNSYRGLSNVLTVGATGPSDEKAPYSSSGTIYAPGGNAGGQCRTQLCVLTTTKEGGYVAVEGTSFAAPHVSGVAALLLSMGYTNARALDRMIATADITEAGLRRINAARAVEARAGRDA
ncbi:MAG: S8 family serine peptidase [Actinomycetota bacterium]